MPDRPTADQVRGWIAGAIGRGIRANVGEPAALSSMIVRELRSHSVKLIPPAPATVDTIREWIEARIAPALPGNISQPDALAIAVLDVLRARGVKLVAHRFAEGEPM